MKGGESNHFEFFAYAWFDNHFPGLCIGHQGPTNSLCKDPILFVRFGQREDLPVKIKNI
jgi:hypothetical protein